MPLYPTFLDFVKNANLKIVDKVWSFMLLKKCYPNPESAYHGPLLDISMSTVKFHMFAMQRFHCTLAGRSGVKFKYYNIYYISDLFLI